MTPRTLFQLILKLFGLYMILGLLQTLPAMFSYGPILGDWKFSESLNFVLIIIGTILFYYFILRLFLFKGSWIIDKLSLDKNFDQEIIDIKIDSLAVIQIAIIILGGLMFIDTLPTLIKEIIFIMKSKQDGSIIRDTGFGYLVYWLCKFVLGYILLTNSKSLTVWINQKNTKQE
jgi:hypothetical protein